MSIVGDFMKTPGVIERPAGANLVRNGNGQFKNTLNWGNGWNVNLIDIPPGAGASYTPKTTAQQVLSFTDVMPLEVGRTYDVSAQVRQRDPAVTTSRFYLGFAPVDVDGLEVPPGGVFYIAGTMTTLAKDLKPGDTTIKLSSAANWYGSSSKPAGASNAHLRGLVTWNYVSPSGRSYGLEYSRNFYFSLWSDGAVDLASNTITLNTPWPSSRGTIPAGTQVSNSTSGSTYVYVPGALNAIAPAAWTSFPAQLKLTPVADRAAPANRGWNWGDYSSAIAGWRFVVLANYSTPGTLGVANVVVSYTLDDMGEPELTGTVSTPVVCDVQMKTSTEVSDGGAIYATGTLRGYFPPETDRHLKDAKLVLDSGEVFTFDGDGWLVRDPFGDSDAFVTAPLKRVS